MTVSHYYATMLMHRRSILVNESVCDEVTVVAAECLTPVRRELFLPPLVPS